MRKKSDWPANSSLPVAVPGLKFVAAGVFAVCIFFAAGWQIAGGIAVFITGFVCWFFRDPERAAPTDSDSAVVSPADGRIVRIATVYQGEYVDGEALKVSIFMNIFNVHVNRIPFSGTIEEINYSRGKFFNASLDKSSEHNERNALKIRTGIGHVYTVVQVAGLVARRIVCKLNKGSDVRRGARYGMICFGSRLDLYLPVNTETTVSEGTRVRAGSTVLGHLRPPDKTTAAT